MKCTTGEIFFSYSNTPSYINRPKLSSKVWDAENHRQKFYLEELLRLIYTSVQVAANQSLGKSPAIGDLHLPIQLRNKEIHSRSNNCNHFL